MGAPYIWGSLDRAVNDDTKIDEAIDIAINAHMANPDAHLGEGEALQSHRAADIIDHRAESVVNDKIRTNARTYVAIVDPAGDGDFTTIEDACDFAYEKGGGTIYIKSGTYHPQRTLQLRYSVDIKGEGPSETHIIMDNAQFKGLNIAGNFSPEMKPLSEFYYYEGDDVAEFYIDGQQGDDEIEYCYAQLPWGDGTFYYVLSPGRIGMWDRAPENGTVNDLVVTPTIDASVSSKIVHMNGWKLASDLEAAEGLLLITNVGELGLVKSYLGNGDFELEDNAWVDAYRSVGVTFSGPAGRMSIIEGISIDVQDASYWLAVDGQKGRLYMRDCAIINSASILKNDLIYNTLEGQGVTIEDTNITFRTGSFSLETAGMTVRNCLLTFPADSIPTMLGGYGSYYENCIFRGSFSDSWNKMAGVARDSRFQSCTFSMMARGNICNTGSYSGAFLTSYVMFSDCEFSDTLTGTCVFTGNNIIVNGCRFWYADRNVGLNTSTRYSTFTGNQGRGTLMAQPTNCIVTANGFWASMT